MPNGWRTINSLVHKIRLHGRRGKGMAESFSRQKSRHAPQKEGGLKILCDLPPVWPRLVRPTNLMSRMDGKKTHTHTHTHNRAIRPCHPINSHSMSLALILPRGDQWYLLRKPLIRRDRGDTLSLLVQLLLEPWVPCTPPPASLLLSRLSGLAATEPILSCMYVCTRYVCMYVFIKLHITTQSGPVILVILCHSHWSSRGGINDMYVCMYVCMYIY